MLILKICTCTESFSQITQESMIFRNEQKRESQQCNPIFTIVTIHCSMADELHQVELDCDLCHRTGTHADTCSDKDLFPLIANIRDEIIASVQTHNGDVLHNEIMPENLTFRNRFLTKFTLARRMRTNDDNTFAWVKLPDYMESSILQIASTTLGGGPGLHHGPIPISTIGENERSEGTPISHVSGNVPGYHCNNTFMNQSSKAFTDSMLTAQTATTLVTSIPIFNGNPLNYPAWKRKVEAARPFQDEPMYLVLVKQKLGTEPTDFIEGLGSSIDTLDGLLKELGRQYDLLANPTYAHHQFQLMRQAGKELAEYHTQFSTSLKAIGRDLSTSDMFIKTHYVGGLDKEGLRLKLNRKNDQNSSVKLKELMEIATTEVRLEKFSKMAEASVAAVAQANVATQSNQTAFETVTPVSHGLPVSTVQFTPPVSSMLPNPMVAMVNPPNPGPPVPTPTNTNGDYCPIHESNKHPLRTCRRKDDTKCMWCNAEFAAGTYAAHMPQCRGRRCYNCKRLGHVTRNCTINKPRQDQGGRFRNNRGGFRGGRGGGGSRRYEANQARNSSQQGGGDVAHRQQRNRGRGGRTNQTQNSNNNPARSRSPLPQNNRPAPAPPTNNTTESVMNSEEVKIEQ